MAPGDEIGVTGRDLDAFERLLHEIQAAFAAEDYAGLRALCTPEIVSYLSEELSQNATRGVRNDVADVKLLQGDLAEAWREGSEEYATVAMRYESVDVMRDRETGETVEGSETPTVTTEVWTFVRPVGGDWKLSAIQDA
jgi:predicted lipid-binding transport protein (Tim44 family)